MRDRLVLVPDQPGQRTEEVLVVDDDLVRVRLDRGRDLARVVELAERAILEGDRKGLQRPVDHLRHQRGDGAAVEAPGQEHAERHVGHQTNADRFLEELAETADHVTVGEACELLRDAACGDVPVPRAS